MSAYAELNRLLLSNSVEDNPLWRSERVENYLGFRG
jgi:hypothetical protein